MSDVVAAKYAEATCLTVEQAQDSLNDGAVQYMCCEVECEDCQSVIRFAHPVSLTCVSPVGNDCGLVITTVLNQCITYFDNLKALCLCGLIA